MNKINWGIIGCSYVSKPGIAAAFNKVKNSSLIAVMDKDVNEAKEYAQKNYVPKWYTGVKQLINDKDINAIYIAVPAAISEEYILAAINAGKPVYIEPPLSDSYSSASNIMIAAEKNNIKVVVANYRRDLPIFKKIKEILDTNIIGKVRSIYMYYRRNLITMRDLADRKMAWQTSSDSVGSKWFCSFAPHQLDLMIYFFGDIKESSVTSSQMEGGNKFSGSITFKSGTRFNGLWALDTMEDIRKDICEIYGSGGTMEFVMSQSRELAVIIAGKKEIFSFAQEEYLQQPMIEKTVYYFLNIGYNPCSAADELEVIRLVQRFSGKWYHII